MREPALDVDESGPLDLSPLQLTAGEQRKLAAIISAGTRGLPSRSSAAGWMAAKAKPLALAACLLLLVNAAAGVFLPRPERADATSSLVRAALVSRRNVSPETLYIVRTWSKP